MGNNIKVADIIMKFKGVKVAANIYKKFSFDVKEIAAIYAQINYIVSDPAFIKFYNVYKNSSYYNNGWMFANQIINNL